MYIGLMGNSKALDDGFRLARNIILAKLEERFDAPAMASVSRAQMAQEYGNFTGNATTAYSVVRYDSRHRVKMTFGSMDYMKKPIFRKIRKGETKYLNPDYDGKPGKVTGKADLETNTTVQAVNLVKRLVSGAVPVLMAYRFMHPVEYEEFLKGEEPIKVLKQEVLARMK